MAGLFGTPLEPEIQFQARKKDRAGASTLLGLAAVASLACFITSVAFANDAWLLGILLLALSLPLAALLALYLMGQTAGPVATIVSAALVVSSVAIVIAAHSQQEGQIERLYTSHCQAYRSGHPTTDDFGAFGGWATRDRSADEVMDWTVENCSSQSSQDGQSTTQDEKSNWSDCDKRIWAVTRYEGFSDEEEQDAVEAIWADCDPTPGTADW